MKLLTDPTEFEKADRAEHHEANMEAYFKILPHYEYDDETTNRIADYVAQTGFTFGGIPMSEPTKRVIFEIEEDDKAAMQAVADVFFRGNVHEDWLKSIIGSKYLVVSKNPVDFMLCATKQNFNSCLSMESQHAYHYGLPAFSTNEGVYVAYFAKDKPKNYKLCEGNEKKELCFKKHFMNMRFFIYAKTDGSYGFGKFYPQSAIKHAMGTLVETLFATHNIPVTREKGYLKGDYWATCNIDKKLMGVYMDDLRLDGYNQISDGSGYLMKGKSQNVPEGKIQYNYCGGSSGPFCQCSFSISMAAKYSQDRIFSKSGKLLSNLGLHSTPLTLTRCYSSDGDGEGSEELECCRCESDYERADMRYTIDEDRPYCPDCYNDSYTTCSGCGDEIDSDDSTRADGNNYCTPCYDLRYVQCEGCSGHIPRDEARITADNIHLCADCHGDNSNYCDDCGQNWWSDDEVNQWHEEDEDDENCDYDDTYLCTCCTNQRIERRRLASEQSVEARDN